VLFLLKDYQLSLFTAMMNVVVVVVIGEFIFSFSWSSACGKNGGTGLEEALNIHSKEATP